MNRRAAELESLCLPERSRRNAIAQPQPGNLKNFGEGLLLFYVGRVLQAVLEGS